MIGQQYNPYSSTNNASTWAARHGKTQTRARRQCVTVTLAHLHRRIVKDDAEGSLELAEQARRLVGVGALGVEAIQVEVEQQLGDVGGAVHRQAVLAEHVQVGHGAGHEDDGVQAATENLSIDVHERSGAVIYMCTEARLRA
jgi:hypothetical protein